MRRDLPVGTVTFLFTDIEGSTRLLHSLGPDVYAEALAEHRRVLRDVFAAYGGVEVDTQGDAFFVAFPTATGAADAARTAQDELESGPISVRMGLHTGTPTVTREGYVGVDVHRGARVGALAHGGQIVLSPATAYLLDGLELRDLGLHRLKDFEGAVRLLQLGLDEFPPLRTPGSVELPTPTTRFLGREQELFDAVSLLYRRDPRVLTVLGPGGIGKTRFCLELCRLLAEDAEGGTVFCALAPLREAALVLPTIAERLGAASPELEVIAARIGDRRTHVLVDNAEHLLPAAALPLAELAQAAPELRLFVTSREPLRVSGEVELDLPPLPAGEASTFFLERAHAVRPDLKDGRVVAELCARLDYLPLALELAAARTKLLNPVQLLERLGNRLDLPGSRDADERHATLRATIAWSYDLLEPAEQSLFVRLSVFAAGCTLESAEVVCDAHLELLASLLDKSLVRRRLGALREERFWMLETVREFAAQGLFDLPDRASVCRRHAERMLNIAHSAHLTEEDDEPFQLPIVLADRDDMRAALDWAADGDVELALELLVALENFWNVHARDEAIDRLEGLLSGGEDIPPRLRARALRVRGGALHIAGHLGSCDEPYEGSLALYRELDDERGIASLTHRLAGSALARGDLERAHALARESVESSRGRFPLIDVPNDGLMGQILLAEGDIDGGTELVRRSERGAADLGWDWWRAGQLDDLGVLALGRGDLDEAVRDSEEALRLMRLNEAQPDALFPLTTIARVALTRGDRRRAGLYWGAVQAQVAREPTSAWERWGDTRAGPLVDEPDSEFSASLAQGQHLDLWDAVAIALGELEAPQTVP